MGPLRAAWTKQDTVGALELSGLHRFRDEALGRPFSVLQTQL